MGTYLNLLDSASSSLYSHISKRCVAYYKYTQHLFLGLKKDKGLLIIWRFHKKSTFVVVELGVSEFTPTPKQMEHLFPWLLAAGSVHMPSRAIFQIFPGLHNAHPSSGLVPTSVLPVPESPGLLASPTPWSHPVSTLLVDGYLMPSS